jgi:hypothetical protein
MTRRRNAWRKLPPLFPDARTDITKTCVTYLSFDTFKDGFGGSYWDIRWRLRSHALYGYSAKYWGDHARVALAMASAEDSAEVDNLILKLLVDEPKVSIASQELLYSGNYHQFNCTQVSGVHLAHTSD